MAQQYLVPCACGRKIPVETRQAGEKIACECGASLEVPRLLELKKLEKVAIEMADAKPRSHWGLGQGLVASAAVLLVGVIVLGVLVLMKYGTRGAYETMTPDEIRAEFQNMTPAQTWFMWMRFQQTGINPPKTPDERWMEDWFAQRGMLLTFLGMAALVDAGVLAGGIYLIRQERKKRGVRAP